MFPFDRVLPLVVASIATVFANPLFWLVVLLVALQYQRMASVRESFFGLKTRRVWSDTLIATGYGIGGGLAGSLLIVFVGLSLSGSSLLYLWPVAILLMLINARFLCFAYAGGVLALTNLIFGFPALNIAQVLALVAILHMVESVLILVSGHLGAVPAYFKDRSGRVVGGFTLQKIWPIPIVVLGVVGQSVAPEGVNMPQWWPLLKPVGIENLERLVYGLFPVVAGLGYGDLAIARNPWQKSKLSALYLGLYSVVLLLLSVLAQSSRPVALLAALFSPLGHELVIYIGRRLEFKDQPVYVPDQRGMRVLDVVVDTPAWQAGIRSGDIILALNGLPVSGRAGMENALAKGLWSVEVEFLHGREQSYRREVSPPVKPGRTFGVLPVPESGEEAYMELGVAGPLGQWWRKLRQKF
jgi:hypothetical protein